MQLSGTGLVALWGKLGGSGTTLAMGAAGTALWGSLAYFSMVGFSGSSGGTGAPLASDDLYYRMELPERVLLEGCKNNYGGSQCTDQAWAILAANADKARTPMPEPLADALPVPLWNDLSVRHAATEPTCADALNKGLPEWVGAMAASSKGPHVAVLPARYTACQGIAAGIDPMREHRLFWYMDGDKVLAQVQCTVPGSYSDPYCQLTAYPENGAQVASFARLPAGNVEDIIARAPEMLAALQFNLPKEIAALTDLDLLDGPFMVDRTAAAAARDLRESVK